MRRFLVALLLASCLTAIHVSTPVVAQVFNGPGLEGGIDAAGTINGPAVGGDIRIIALKILYYVLSFLGLVAVIVIVIAGIRLIVSQGEEEQKEKAKKTILYLIAGLLVIMFANIIVYFLLNILPAEL